MLLGMWESVKEWTLTLPSELPLWEFESQWTLESLERNWRGQKPLDWRFCYIIEKLLELRYLKWACMTHLDTSNISYGQKKGWKSNCQILLVCRRLATYRWKVLHKVYNFASNLISIRGPHTKLWPLKVAGVLTLGISRLPFRSPGRKWHLGVGPVARHRVYYKGKVVASPKFELWWVLWVLWIRVCSWFVRAPKAFKLCTNQLVVWFV
jgi:hypothetical protein